MICDNCLNKDTDKCEKCRDNPEYAKYFQMQSYHQLYKPTCPKGYTDCVCDPAYIKCYDPEWYKELYGDKTPEEAAEECKKRIEADPDNTYECYDDEDK